MRLRPVLVLTAFVLFTLPLMPVQAVLKRTSPALARRFPNWYHRYVCRILGVSLEITGKVAADRPVLLVSNHVSWLDIPVVSAVAPVSFVAKKEVAGWPFVSALARLQRTVFVDRERRTSVGATANEIMDRLGQGDTIVLFAEGTSSDGNRVLPFRTSLFAAVKPNGLAGATAAPPGTVVQTLSVAYTRMWGVPLGWEGRRAFGYYGDVAMGANAWDVLSGPLEARIIVGEPVPLDSFAGRKELARWAEDRVREGLVEATRG